MLGRRFVTAAIVSVATSGAVAALAIGYGTAPSYGAGFFPTTTLKSTTTLSGGQYQGSTSTSIAPGTSIVTVPVPVPGPTVTTPGPTVTVTVTVTGSTTTAPGTSTTTLPSSVTSINLPVFYAGVTTEGKQLCSYKPGSSITTTVDLQLGPTFTADKNGCLTVAVTYLGGTSYRINHNSAVTFTLGTAGHTLALTGTGTNGVPMVTNVNFRQRNFQPFGQASSIKGKGVSWVSLGLIGAAIAALLLGAGAAALRVFSRRPTAGSDDGLLGGDRDDDEDEEEGEGDEGFGDGEFGDGDFGDVPELPPEVPAAPSGRPR